MLRAPELSAPVPSRRRLPAVLWLVLPGLLTLGAFFLIPLLRLLVLSFYPFVQATGQTVGPALDNWRRFFGDAYYLRIFRDTLLLAGIVTGATVLLGYPLAYFLARLQTRFRTVLLIAVTFPLLTSSVVRTFAWLVLLADNGIVNRLLMGTGAIGAPLKLMYTWPAVIIGLTQVFLPFMVLTLFGVLRNINVSLEEAAENLGANRWQTFARVVLPLSLPGVTAGSLLVFSLTASSFVTPALMGGPRVRILPNLIFEQTLVVFDWPFASTASLILLAVALTLSVYVSRLGEVGGVLGAKQ